MSPSASPSTSKLITKQFMTRRELNISPLTHNKYNGLDILVMGSKFLHERRLEEFELFEYSGKINKGREAMRKLIRDYRAKKHLKRSIEETEKLLRPLNPQELSKVNEAMKKGVESEILAKTGNDSVTRRSMLRLRPQKWLNDEIINYFLKNCLASRDEKLCAKDPGRRRSHFFNTFFVQTLFNEKNVDRKIKGQYNYEMVRRWSKLVPTRNIFELKYIFCPINSNNKHWTLAVIYMEAKKIQYFDSLGGTDWEKLEGLLKYVKDEYRATHEDKEMMDANEWKLVPCTSDTPRQMNGEFHFFWIVHVNKQFFTLRSS